MQDTEANARIERLQEEAAALGVKPSDHRRDGILQAAGLAMMVIAVVVALVAYQASLGSSDERDIQSLLVLAVAMVAFSLLGAALFVRSSMARFLRFWMLRQLYESRRD